MATLEQSIALKDGVSSVLNRMATILEKTSIRFKQMGATAANAEKSFHKSVYNAQKSIADIHSTSVPQLTRVAHSFETCASSAQHFEAGICSAAEETPKIIEAIAKITKPTGLLKNVALPAAVGNVIGNYMAQVVDLIGNIPAKLVKASDEYAGIMSRLKIVTGSQEQAVALNEAIYRSAQRARGSYAEMADSVGKIAMTAKEAFPDAKDVVPFVEGIQKLFAIGGTDMMQQKNAMLQLTQALGSGRLQGDEFRSIAEAAPLIEQMVSRYLGVTQGELKKLASEGVVTADVVKNAIMGNMAEIDSMFNSMGMTWEQLWQMMSDAGLKEIQPILEKIRQMANSGFIQRMMSGVISAFGKMADLALMAMNEIEWALNTLAENMAYIEPLIMGTAIALGALGVKAAWSYGIAAVGALAHAAASATETAATIALLIAQNGLNAALAACPLNWYILLVVALVGVFYAAVAVVNYFLDTNISATGLICGAFAGMAAVILNVMIFVRNVVVKIAEALVNAFSGALEVVHDTFAFIWNGIVGLVGKAVNSIIDMIKQIPGMNSIIGDIGHVNTSGLSIGYMGTSKRVQYDMKDYVNVGDWANSGYDFGANGISLPDISLPDNSSNQQDIKSAESAIADAIDSSDAGKGVKDTAGNTKAMKDAMEVTEDDLKYLRDIAEQEAVNRYTTATVKIDMGGITNNVSSDTDIDGMISHLNDGLFNAMVSGAEKVHPA